MRTFPRLAFVCPMPWSAMVGDERSRFCSVCRKSVTNLSVLSEDERKALLAAARPGELCVAYQRGLEGKPVGLGSRLLPDPNLRRHAVAAVAAGTILATAAISPGSARDRSHDRPNEEPILLGMLDVSELPLKPEPPTEPAIECTPPKLVPPAGMNPEPPKKIELKLPV